MPHRTSFDCLWCGHAHTVRAPDELEGFAQLCPECVVRAQDNEFLRYRVRTALAERAASLAATTASRRSTTSPPVTAPGPVTTPPSVDPSPIGALLQADAAPVGTALGAEDPDLVAYYDARAGEYDDWYLRRGRYSHGSMSDLAWQAELDGATGWLDTLPWRGEIVELAAGTGWWSPLLAQKGDLSIYDLAEAPLDRARDRLMAHRLRAHIHLRDAWAEPDRQVDGLFCGFWLSHIARHRLPSFMALARRWLKPGGLFAFVDSLPDADSGARDHPRPHDDIAVRRLDDGREFRIVKVHYAPGEMEGALRDAGFTDVRVTTTGRSFMLGTGVIPL